MSALIVVIKIVFLLVAATLTFIVLLQRGKVQGLSGAIAGAGDSYWGKNKARSMEGGLHRFTAGLAIAFIVLALLLNILA